MHSPTLATLLSLCLTVSTGLAACGSRTPQPNPSSSPSSSSSPTSSPSTSPSSGGLTPTSAPVSPAKYKYDLPLSVRALPECDGQEQLLYQVSATGNLRYYPGEYNPSSGEAPLAMKSKQLSEAQYSTLRQLINQANIAEEFENSKKVPDDAPRTLECRTVMTYTLNVDGSDKTYDANGRSYEHTQAYRDGLERLQNYLKHLTTDSGSSAHYGLAMKAYRYLECDQKDIVDFEISATGELKSLAGTDSNPQYKTRALGRLEIKEVDDLLTELQLVSQFKQQAQVPPGSPQTEECRDIRKLDFEVEGQPETIEAQRSRTIAPSSDYLAAVDKLIAKLTELASR